MTTELGFTVAGWIVVLAIGIPLLHQVFAAHHDIDCSLVYAARIHLLRSVGLSILELSFVGVMIGIRHLIPTLLFPIVLGGGTAVFTLWLVVRGHYRIRHEFLPSIR
jgi:hypothetical protein